MMTILEPILRMSRYRILLGSRLAGVRLSIVILNLPLTALCRPAPRLYVNFAGVTKTLTIVLRYYVSFIVVSSRLLQIYNLGVTLKVKFPFVFDWKYKSSFLVTTNVLILSAIRVRLSFSFFRSSKYSASFAFVIESAWSIHLSSSLIYSYRIFGGPLCKNSASPCHIRSSEVQHAVEDSYKVILRFCGRTNISSPGQLELLKICWECQSVSSVCSLYGPLCAGILYPLLIRR